MSDGQPGMRPLILYKYMSSHGGRSALTSGSFWWSTPSLFNDPFDLAWDFENGVTNAEVDIALQEEIFQLSKSATVPLHDLSDLIRPIIARLRFDAKAISEVELYRRINDENAADLSDMRGPLLSRFSDEWAAFVNGMRILCLSEIPDSILMWTHYAESHAGIVIGLRTDVGEHRPQDKAIQVEYVDDVPILVSPQRWVRQICYGENPLGPNYARRVLATKSMAWAYEAEWRIAKKAGVPPCPIPRNGVEAVPFLPSELASIHFGCRTSDEVIDDVMQTVRSMNACVEIFRFRTPTRRFQLEADRIA